MANLFSSPKRILIITIILAAVIIGIGYVRSLGNKPYPEEVSLDYPKLYDEALKAKKKGDLNTAQETLQKIVLGDPKYKNASKLLDAITKENLYKKLKDSLARNQLAAAKDYLSLLNNLDPNYRDSAQIRDDVNKGTNPSDNPNDPGPPGTGSGNSIPDLLPIQLLPDKIDGFNILARNWIKPGTEANAAYRHVEENRDDWSITDLVLITAAKYDDENGAKVRFLYEKDTFPKESSMENINSHEAYFGLYAEKMFVYPGSLIWTQGRWFLSVTVLPKPPSSRVPEMSRDTELRIAKDVAGKFGY